MIEKQIPVSMEGSQLEVLKYALFGISALTLVGAYFFRKLLLKNISRPVQGAGFQSDTYPAGAKYLIVIVIIMALSESVGIYGVVLFFISKDVVSLYQLIILSAVAMVGFRPKKGELIEVAEKMKLPIFNQTEKGAYHEDEKNNRVDCCNFFFAGALVCG